MKYNKYIDHTLLKAFATKEEIIKLCNEAKQFDFKSVCVNPVNVRLAKELLCDSNVLVCTVIGFPLGANTIETKRDEAIDACNNGADELDMVINIGKAKEHDYDYIIDEISTVVKAAPNKLIKVIIETCYLTDEEKVECSKAATIAGANFVKTSTGFGPSGATLDDVKLMKASISTQMCVKASGGVKTFEDAEKYIEAGASRIGTSNGIAIASDPRNK